MKASSWDNLETLKDLLLQLVKWQSLTGTKGEQAFAHLLKGKLLNNKHVYAKTSL